MATIRDLSVLITPLFTIYCLFLIVKKLNGTQAHAEQSIKGPIVYNSKININLWLSEIEEYLDAKSISNDTDKRDAVLDKLDTRTRATIQKLIDGKKLKTFQDLEEALKSYFGRETITNANYVIQLMERHQMRNESINEFHNAIQDLAQAAHPKLEKGPRDNIVRQQFIKGLLNRAVKNQLRLKARDDEAIKILVEAIDLNKTLPIEDDNEIFACHHMQEMPQGNEPQPHFTTQSNLINNRSTTNRVFNSSGTRCKCR